MGSYSRDFHFAINCWQSIVVHYLVPGPTPCPEVVAISYIRPAEVPTLFSVEGEAQVKQQNTVVGFLTNCQHSVCAIQTSINSLNIQHWHTEHQCLSTGSIATLEITQTHRASSGQIWSNLRVVWLVLPGGLGSFAEVSLSPLVGHDGYSAPLHTHEIQGKL